MLTQLLTRAGYVCTGAENGQVALGVWKRAMESGSAFDVALVDKVRAYDVDIGAQCVPAKRVCVFCLRESRYVSLVLLSRVRAPLVRCTPQR